MITCQSKTLNRSGDDGVMRNAFSFICLIWTIIGIGYGLIAVLISVVRWIVRQFTVPERKLTVTEAR